MLWTLNEQRTENSPKKLQKYIHIPYTVSLDITATIKPTLFTLQLNLHDQRITNWTISDLFYEFIDEQQQTKFNFARLIVGLYAIKTKLRWHPFEEKPQVVCLHLLHLWPTTFGLHRHSPPFCAQILLNDPIGSPKIKDKYKFLNVNF